MVTSMAPTKGAVTRQEILRAAIARFGRDGFRSTSVTDIARDAGVAATAPYAYFDGKEALFLAAVDEDAAGVIHEGLAGIFDHPTRPDQPAAADWRNALLTTLVTALQDHPLARRLLAGLEPEVTRRVLDIPALTELRTACADRLRAEQAAGSVRPDLDPATTANGIVAILLSLLMSVVQLGVDAVYPYADDVSGVFRAALDPLPQP
jgi:AcrR family transcriptional regulator